MITTPTIPPEVRFTRHVHGDGAADLEGMCAPACDFTRLDCHGARARVSQLIHAGLSDHCVADLVGWSVDDVRRSIGAALDDQELTDTPGDVDA